MLNTQKDSEGRQQQDQESTLLARHNIAAGRVYCSPDRPCRLNMRISVDFHKRAFGSCEGCEREERAAAGGEGIGEEES